MLKQKYFLLLYYNINKKYHLRKLKHKNHKDKNNFFHKNVLFILFYV